MDQVVFLPRPDVCGIHSPLQAGYSPEQYRMWMIFHEDRVIINRVYGKPSKGDRGLAHGFLHARQLHVDVSCSM